MKLAGLFRISLRSMTAAHAETARSNVARADNMLKHSLEHSDELRGAKIDTPIDADECTRLGIAAGTKILVLRDESTLRVCEICDDHQPRTWKLIERILDFRAPKVGAGKSSRHRGSRRERHDRAAM